MKHFTVSTSHLRLLLLIGVLFVFPFTHVLLGLAAPSAQVVEDPEIEIWYGLHQSFGEPGWPQDRINILGNVSHPGGEDVLLQMRLNGGAWLDVRVGGENPTIASDRLESKGDFNIELFDRSYHPQIGYTPRPGEILRNGMNILELRAGVDGQTWPASETVTIDYREMGGAGWPLRYDIHWADAGQINNVARVVDGDWRITSGGNVRTTVPGYDRLIALGDMQWDDYEVETSFIVHELVEPDQGGVGLILGWQGHFNSGDELPLSGWHRMGVYGYYSFRYDGSLMLRTGQNVPPIGPLRQLREVDLGERYHLKLRVETDPNNPANSYYAIKMWPAGEAEPEGWDLGPVLETNDQRTRGSVLLVVHELDVSFGDVRVRPLNGPDCFTLTATAGPGGYVTVNPAANGEGCYPAGTQVTVTAVPDPGYQFAGWSGDDGVSSITGLVLNLTMNANRSVQASFTPVQQDCHTLIVLQPKGGHIQVDPALACYPSGTLVRFQANPDPGYLFSHWVEDLAGASGPSAELQVVMPATVGAVFLPVQAQMYLPMLSK